MKSRAKSTVAAVGVTAVLAVPQVKAQQDIDEIVVTARKKEEVVLDIPMNISTITETEIKARNIIDKTELYRTIAGAASPRGELILRGLSGSNSAYPNTTNVWTDGIPFDFDNVYDVERVEVLRGPQGTLYGSNAIGGTVHVITNKPNLNELEISGSVMFKNEAHRPGTEVRAFGVVNVPIVEGSLGLRVTGQSGSKTGKILNLNDGHRGETEDEFLRAQLLWEPNDKTQVNLSVVRDEWFSDEYSDVDLSTPPYYYEAILTPNADATYGYDVALTFPDCPSGASRPECKIHSIGALVQDGYNPDFATWYLLNHFNANETSLVGLTIDRQDIIDGVDLSYAGSYRDSDTSGRQNHWSRYDAQDMFRTWIDDTNGWNRFTHELRLQSSGDGPIEWTVGAFHDDSRGKENPNVQWQYHASDNRSRAIADYLWGYWWGYEDPTQLGIDVYGNGNVHYNGSQLRWDDTETAYFGEASYTMDLQDGKTLELTGGIRFYDIENDYYYTDSGLWNNDVTDIKDGEDGNRIKLSANYRPTENFAVFGIYSEGYRPGGNNGSAPPVSCRNDPAVGDYSDRYTSDETENMEIGFKGLLFDRRVQFSGAIYQIDWSGVQARVYMETCGFSYTANAATAESRGFELETTSMLTDDLKLIVNYSSTQSEMTSDVPSIGASKGDDMTMVPKYNYYIALDKEITFRGRDGNLRLDVNGYGKYKSHFNVRDQDISDAYEVVNLQASLQVSENTTINVVVNNLLDDRIVRYKNARSRNIGSYWNIYHTYYIPDRTVALRMDYSF
jgi:outer membrane receptor protein involved in Fe transport